MALKVNSRPHHMQIESYIEPKKHFVPENTRNRGGPGTITGKFTMKMNPIEAHFVWKT